jgi:hypothetical protein
LVVDQISQELEELRQEPINVGDPGWMKEFKKGDFGMEETLARKFAQKLNDFYEQCEDPTKLVFTISLMTNVFYNWLRNL